MAERQVSVSVCVPEPTRIVNGKAAPETLIQISGSSIVGNNEIVIAGVGNNNGRRAWHAGQRIDCDRRRRRRYRTVHGRHRQFIGPDAQFGPPAGRIGTIKLRWSRSKSGAFKHVALFPALLAALPALSDMVNVRISGPLIVGVKLRVTNSNCRGSRTSVIWPLQVCHCVDDCRIQAVTVVARSRWQCCWRRSYSITGPFTEPVL